jgi:hypothetical protein
MTDERRPPEEGEKTKKRTHPVQPEVIPQPGAAPAAATGPVDKGPEKSAAEKADDPEAETKLWEMKRQRALADANKPIEPAAEAIWSTEPDKLKARTAIEAAYRKAARKGSDQDSEGELHARYRRATDKFIDAAADMLRSRQGRGESNGESHLGRWIKTYLSSGAAPVRTMLRERKQVATRLARHLGERERSRDAAADETKRWEKAFGRWSSPDKEIGAQIASYADRIDQLNADINTNNNRDQAIFSFWFEVAPSHLQLQAGRVTDDDAPGVSKIRDALAEFPLLLRNFLGGEERNDGSLYLIDPDELPKKREAILKAWQDAAGMQARAEADYSTRPDAAADLKPRHDKLKDDGWVKGAKEALATPKP